MTAVLLSMKSGAYLILVAAQKDRRLTAGEAGFKDTALW
jgi:hypothetical protein